MVGAKPCESFARLCDIFGDKARRDEFVLAAIAECRRKSSRAAGDENCAAVHQISRQITGLPFWGDAGPDKWFEQDETFDQAKHPADLGRHRLDGRA